MSEFSISEIEKARRTTAALEGGRRVRRYLFTPCGIQMLFTHGNRVLVSNGIPDGCVFKGFTIDHERNVIAIFLEHESFSVVAAGSRCPDGPEIEFERIL